MLSRFIEFVKDSVKNDRYVTLIIIVAIFWWLGHKTYEYTQLGLELIGEMYSKQQELEVNQARVKDQVMKEVEARLRQYEKEPYGVEMPIRLGISYEDYKKVKNGSD